MEFRSLLFVPGDRPERFQKALDSAADGLILDLEDSVAPSRKTDARQAVIVSLSLPRSKPVFVRINPIPAGGFETDLPAVLKAKPDGIVLPKAEGAKDVLDLTDAMGDTPVPVLPIATETPRALFKLDTYEDVSSSLCGLTWGAEDLPATIGASSSRETDGSYTPPFEWVRSVALFAAHAAGVKAVETVYPNIKDIDGLTAYAARARRDGFTAMMAIHPSQCQIINDAFTPSDDEIAHAMKIIEAFQKNPDAGALQVDGKMVDAPHEKQARKLVAQWKQLTGQS